MRILSLKIDNHKIFNPSPKIILGKDLQLLIGVNGSGKSTVLEAIAIIFSEVKRYCEEPKRRERKFNFIIEYSFTKGEINGEHFIKSNSKDLINHISISSSKETGLEYAMFVDKVEIKSPQEMYNYLPDNLIFCYSGICETLENIIGEIEDDQAKALWRRKSNESIDKVVNSLIKNLIYIRKEYYPLLFALNYIDNEQILPLSNKKFSIRSIVFYIQQPKEITNKDYKNLYNLQGFLRLYLDNLLKHSYGIEKDVDTEEPFFSIDYHRGILEAIEKLPNLSDDQRNNQSQYLAFHLISLLFRIGLIKEISISINDESGNVYLFDDFSEGEQQLVILDAVKKVLCRNNTVIFLDEPDAYLHPQRQRELIPHLNEIFSESYPQIIATSHSPSVAQSVDIENILIFNKKGKVSSHKDDILSYTSINDELFGIQSEFKLEIELKITEFQILVSKALTREYQIDKHFYNLRTELNKYGESVRFITSFETRKLISNGIEVL